jgi:hypothetical protein
VPTGGAGVAYPAGSCNVTTVRIFLATVVFLVPFYRAPTGAPIQTVEAKAEAST